MLESLFAKTFGKILAYLRVLTMFLPKVRDERIIMASIARDKTLLFMFLNHLQETGALSVPAEDLNVAVDEIAVRMSALEEMLGGDIVYDKEEKNAKRC